jgi:hypothetical protein
VYVQTSPQGAPVALVLLADSTNETQITVEMTEVLDSDVVGSGGSPILSYSLEWDWGTSGAGYVAVTGYASDSLQLLYTATGLTAGEAYQFRYRLRNTYGWGAYSPVLVAVAANPPSTPTQPRSSNTGTSVQLNWAEPYTGGSAILELDIEILASDGSFFADLIYCNGVSDATVRAQAYCVIPMSVLTASPFNLLQGDLVVARMLATNIVGSSDYSISTVQAGETYADVCTVPLKPPTAPTRGDASSTAQIEALIAPLTGAETGGDTILSYRIQWDEGTPGTWADLQGYGTNSLALSVITSGLTISQVYQYRYQARNVFGWSADFSDPASIATMTEPDPVDASSVTVTAVGTNVEVQWTAPASNGSPITAYEVLFADTNAATNFVALSTYCVADDSAVLADAGCTFPMSEFWASNTASPVNMAAGDPITLKIRASNAAGTGNFGGVVVSSLVVMTVPEPPANPPTRDEAGTSSSQITVEMPEVSTGQESGYASISSYNLEWNQGAGTVFYELSGGTTESLTRQILTTLVTAGQSYTFRYRVKNLFGFSTSYSPEASILAADKPDAPTAATLAIAGVNVDISWVPPATNGASLISYSIQIADVHGAWQEDTTYCDGADSDVKANAVCAVPMSVLRDPAGTF